MFKNISFFLPIFIIAIVNVLLVAVPAILLWIRDVLDDHSVCFDKLDKRKIQLYGFITTILFTITETMLLIFVFFSNGLMNTLHCVAFQILIFIVLLLLPRLVYFLGTFSVEISKFLYRSTIVVLDIILTTLSVIILVPYLLFKFLWYCCKKVIKKSTN